MKKLLLTLFMTMLTLTGTCFAEGTSFEAQGIKVNLPEGFKQTAPRMGFLMEARDAQNLAEFNISTAPEDDYTPNEADLQRNADYLFQSYGRRGTTMTSKAVVDVLGNHRGISLKGEKQLGQNKMERQWLVVVMHNKRYIVLCTYTPEQAAAVDAAMKSFSCTLNH